MWCASRFSRDLQITQQDPSRAKTPSRNSRRSRFILAFLVSLVSFIAEILMGLLKMAGVLCLGATLGRPSIVVAMLRSISPGIPPSGRRSHGLLDTQTATHTLRNDSETIKMEASDKRRSSVVEHHSEILKISPVAGRVTSSREWKP
jgi:hypothetical protein